MTDGPEHIIDAYLAMVSDHLDESIADEIIAELRTVMIAAAEDISGGEMNMQSAKKVVARFGAPSEVAAEYTYSMFPERIEAPAKGPSAREKDLARVGVPSSYSAAFGKAAKLAVLFSIAFWLGSLFLYPPLLYVSLLIPLIQVSTVLLVFGAFLRKQRQKGLIPYDRTYREWAFWHRGATFPENASIRFGGKLAYLDSFLSVAAFLLFSLIFILPAPVGYSFMIGYPLILLFGCRAILGFQRLGDKDPASFAKYEILLDAPILWLLDVTSQLVFGAWISNSTPITLFLSLVAFLVSPYIIFQIVINLENLWVETDYYSPSETVDSASMEVIMVEAKKASIRIIRRVSQFYASVAIIGTALLLIANASMFLEFIITRGIGVLLIVLWTYAGSLLLALLYIGVKFYVLTRGHQKSFLKQRHRVEALSDFLLSVIILLLILPMNPSMGAVLNQVSSVFLHRHALFYFTIMGSAIAAILFALLSLTFRIIADLGDFLRSGKDNGPSAMRTSGIMFMLSLAALTGFVLIGLDMFGHNIGVLLIALVASVPISIQEANATGFLQKEPKPPEIGPEHRTAPSMSNS
ncbi:MAG: hypothetical protein EAX95_04360 [Candidatus Thorarchaeota archaeon]|nr:hypothetical protein [Candidatus Thorarchaeota archaeon]